MNKKIFILFILGLFIFVRQVQADYVYGVYSDYQEKFRPEISLYILDKGNHLPEEFSPFINDVCRSHPGYTKGEVAYLVTLAYKTLKQEQSDISIYEVAKDIRRFSSDTLGIDLSTLFRAYLNSQVK